MKAYVEDIIEGLAVADTRPRPALYTGKNSQLVIMALMPNEELGAEALEVDRFFRVEEGFGEVVRDGVRTPIQAGFAAVVPAGTTHTIVNTGTVPLKLYALSTPQPRAA